MQIQSRISPKKFSMLRVNSLWLSDVIWWYRSEQTLAKVMVHCLMAPNHYLNQCWLIFKGVLWHSAKSNSASSWTSLIARSLGTTWVPSGADRTQVGPMLAPGTLLSGIICNVFGEYTLELLPHLPGANELTALLVARWLGHVEKAWMMN